MPQTLMRATCESKKRQRLWKR